jgi:hypothetical protein
VKKRTRFFVALFLVSLVSSNLIVSGTHALGHLTEEEHHDCGHDHHSEHQPNSDTNQDNFEPFEQSCKLCWFLVFTGEQPYSFSNSTKGITLFDTGSTIQGQTKLSFVCQILVSDRAPPCSLS